MFLADNYSLRDPYDKIIRCLGFKVRIPATIHYTQPCFFHLYSPDCLASHFSVISRYSTTRWCQRKAWGRKINTHLSLQIIKVKISQDCGLVRKLEMILTIFYHLYVYMTCLYPIPYTDTDTGNRQKPLFVFSYLSSPPTVNPILHLILF